MFRCTTVVTIFISPLFAQLPRFTVHDLGALNNGSIAGINLNGQVIGSQTQPDGAVRSFRTAPNSAINWTTDNLGSLGGSTTRAHGINTSGQVVGESTLTTGELRAFRTAPNASIQPATDNLGTINGHDTQAFAINDEGRVTGGSGHAFLTAPNRPIDPATDDIDLRYGQFNTDSLGLHINNQGHILGEITGYPIYPTAFLNTGRSAQRLDVVSYIWQDFTGLTDQDQIVFDDGVTKLLLWQNGTVTTLADCTAPCVPTSINNLLQVVGSTPKNQFLYSNGTLYDLTTLLPQNSGWTLPNTSGGPSSLVINDAGQIAGIANLNNEPHAFRLDPIPDVSIAIQKTLNLLSSMLPNSGRRTTLPTLMKLTLASQLNSALVSWTGGNASATRGLLNQFESSVRAQTGQTLTNDEANQLIQMAEAAYALT